MCLKASAHFSQGMGFGGVLVDALMMHHPNSLLCTFWMVLNPFVPENRIAHFWVILSPCNLFCGILVLWTPKFLKWAMCHGKHFHRIAHFWVILWKWASPSMTVATKISKRDHRIAHFWAILWAKLWQVIESPTFGWSWHKRVKVHVNLMVEVS
jgi:hypothetical protein